MNYVSKNILDVAQWPAPLIWLSVTQSGPSALLKLWVGKEPCKGGALALTRPWVPSLGDWQQLVVMASRGSSRGGQLESPVLGRPQVAGPLALQVFPFSFHLGFHHLEIEPRAWLLPGWALHC